MNERSDPTLADDDALDALLASARWPEFDADTTARLRRTLRESRPRRIAPMVVVVAAAAIAVVVTVVVRRDVPRSGSDQRAATNRAEPQRDGDRLAAVRPTEVDPPKRGGLVTPVPVPVRDANAYERMMFAVLSAREESRPATPATPAATAPIDAIAARRILRAQLARRDATLDPAALRSLAGGGTADAGDVAILMRCLRRPEARRPAMDAIAARDDRAGVDLLIRLVLDRATRGDALAAVRRGASPATIDALLARLGAAPRVDDRLAAARAVGATCDLRALDRLAGMVGADRSRRGALAAILSCESPSARQLVARLRLDPAMAAQLVAIRAELDSLFS